MQIIPREIIEFNEQPCPYCERMDAGCVGFRDGTAGLCVEEGFYCAECGKTEPMLYGVDLESRLAWCELYAGIPDAESPQAYPNRPLTRREKLRARARSRKLRRESAALYQHSDKEPGHDH